MQAQFELNRLFGQKRAQFRVESFFDQRRKQFQVKPFFGQNLKVTLKVIWKVIVDGNLAGGPSKIEGNLKRLI